MSYFYPDKVATTPYTIKSLFGIRNKKAKAEQIKKEAEAKAEEAPVPAAEEPVVEPQNTVQAEEAPEAVDYSKLTKAKLVDIILAQHGADADVSGTKAELLEKYFN